MGLQHTKNLHPSSSRAPIFLLSVWLTDLALFSFAGEWEVVVAILSIPQCITGVSTHATVRILKVGVIHSHVVRPGPFPIPLDHSNPGGAAARHWDKKKGYIMNILVKKDIIPTTYLQRKMHLPLRPWCSQGWLPGRRRSWRNPTRRMGQGSRCSRTLPFVQIPRGSSSYL